MPTSRFDSLLSRPRWTREDAREVIAALERSGQSVSIFAADHGIDPQRVYLWRRRLGEAEPTTFQEIVVRPPSAHFDTVPHHAPFEIALVSGDVVRVPPSFDAAALARLLDVLVRARSC
jgi:transposase-like protein